MIINLKMILEYDGSRYNGWQKQGNTDNTIQGRLENIFTKFFSQEIEVHGSGRTDAGVHALGQVINIKVDTSLSSETFDDMHMLCTKLNSYLPEDIRILSITEVDMRFHARLNAKTKTYRYTICVSDKRPVFNRKYCMHLSKMPNIELMEKASEKLSGTKDLACFSDTKTKKSTIRRVDNISFSTEATENETYIHIEFTGNGFLYHTVRLMTGTLIYIGLGNNSHELIDEIFKTNNRKLVPFMAPAEGLSLISVHY